MADQRNPFRFRLPWAAPVAAAPRQGAAPAPAPSRPPFRPPGAAPVQPPPGAELSAPPLTTTQTEGGSKPASPRTPKQSSTATPPKTVQPPGSPVAKGPQATTTSPQLPRSPPSPQATTISQLPGSPPSPQATATSPRLPRSPPSPRATTTSSQLPRSPPLPRATTTSPRPPRSPPLPQSQTRTAHQPSQNAPDSDAKPHSNLKPIPESETSPKESEEVKRVLDEPIRNQHGGPEASRKPAKTYIPSYPKAAARNHYPGGCVSEAHSPKEIKGDISRFLNKLGTGQANQTLDSNRQMTIITLAGENRGASMTLGNEARQRDTSIHIHRGYKTNPDESSEESSHEEGRKKPGDSKTDQDSRAYMNSNVQGVNNSLVFNGSVSTRNPGVKYVLSRSFVEPADGRQYETRKAEFNASSPEKLAYVPTVRRRCLRGLLMESSDSDADNPGKPRRHGCRYDCKKKNKDGSPGVL